MKLFFAQMHGVKYRYGRVVACNHTDALRKFQSQRQDQFEKLNPNIVSVSEIANGELCNTHIYVKNEGNFVDMQSFNNDELAKLLGFQQG